MPIKRILLTIIAIVTIAIIWLDYSHNVRMPHANTVATAKVKLPLAPDFGFQSIDTGDAHSLQDFKGKTILINFWASWCVPCLYEFPMLVDLATQYPDDLILILLSTDDTKKQAYEFARGFCIRHHLMEAKGDKLFPQLPNLYIAWDEDKRIAQDIFQTIRYPETILITPDLRIEKKIIGALTEEDIEYIQTLIEP